MDCNKTIDYLKELERMCSSYEDECVGCPLHECCIGDAWVKNPKQAIEIVQKWSDEHPPKTYMEDFFEKFPSAPKFQMGGHPKACREAVYGGECPMNEGNKDNNCFKCWNEPMEE